jgi:hypothetical protein
VLGLKLYAISKHKEAFILPRCVWQYTVRIYQHTYQRTEIVRHTGLCTLVNPAFISLGLEDWELKARLGYIGRPYLKMKQQGHQYKLLGVLHSSKGFVGRAELVCHSPGQLGLALKCTLPEQVAPVLRTSNPPLPYCCAVPQVLRSLTHVASSPFSYFLCSQHSVIFR